MIHRSKHDVEFTRVKNSLINDDRLSFEARGFLIFMLALPDDWNFSIKGLAFKSNLSSKSVMRMIKELKAAGYITQKKVKGGHGYFSTYEWDIYESSELTICGTSVRPNFRETELPKNGTSEERNFRERDHVLTNNNNKLINITNDSLEQTNNGHSQKFAPPTIEEVRSYCLERNNGIDAEAFVDFYTSKGWKVGKNPMKDWKAAVRTWEKRTYKPNPIQTSGNEFTDLLDKEGFSI